MNHPHSSNPPATSTGWFPHPVLSALLAASWLALSHSLAVVHLLSALLIGWAVPRWIAPFLGLASHIHWPSALRLIGVVLWDIVMSNITVARLVLGPMDRPQPGWIEVPVDTDHPWVNALFATIITTTPGTVSAVVDERGACILVHALDCSDAPAMARDMKTRYEAPLVRIFGAQPRSHT